MAKFNVWSTDGKLGFFAWYTPDLFIPAKKQAEGVYEFFLVDGKRVEMQALGPCLDFLAKEYVKRPENSEQQEGTPMPKLYHEDEVRAGMALLDRYDATWFYLGRIITPLLNMASPHSCVLGMLFGDYDDGLQKLHLGTWDSNQAVKYGFAAGDIDPMGYWYLTQTWVKLINEKRQAAGPEASVL